jgi:hypothetical protein
MNRRTVVFEVTDLAKLDIFAPVIRVLGETHGLRSQLIVSSEVHNQRTRLERIDALGVEYVQIMPVPIGSRRMDWVLFNVWLRRNAGRILQDLKTAVLVEPNDRTYPHHFFIDAAKRMGIPTVLVQESLRKDETMRLSTREWFRRKLDLYAFGVNSRLRKYGQGNCDAVTAWGEFSREYYRRVGVPEDRIAVTGNPAFDVIDEKDWTADAAAVSEQLDVRNERVVLFLTSPLARIGVVSMGRQERLTDAVLEGFRAYQAVSSVPLRLIIKPHALENARDYSERARSCGLESAVRVTSELPLYPLIARADAVVISSTTAGVEAGLFRKPLAVVDGGAPLDNWDLVGRGVGTRVRDSGEFAAFLRTALDPVEGGRLGAAARRGAEQFATTIGNGAANVAKVIAEFVADERIARAPLSLDKHAISSTHF